MLDNYNTQELNNALNLQAEGYLGLKLNDTCHLVAKENNNLFVVNNDEVDDFYDWAENKIQLKVNENEENNETVIKEIATDYFQNI